MIAYVLPKNQKKVKELRAEYNRMLDVKWLNWDRLNEGPRVIHERMFKMAAASAHERMMKIEEQIQNLTEWLTP
jgi:hypothetical protein